MGPPHGVLPGILDVSVLVARSDTVAIVVGPMRVWPEGLVVNVNAVTRDAGFAPLRPLPRELYREAGRSWPPPELLRFGVAYADGKRATNLDVVDYRPPHGVWLQARGLSGGSGGFSSEYWLSPLPRNGQVVFVCEWPEYGVDEASVKVDAAAIQAAAGRAHGVWST
jgi:hypothetical protein